MRFGKRRALWGVPERHQEVAVPPEPVLEVIRTPADGVGRGFSGSEDADRLKRHESRRRAMAHVADHLSFETLAGLEQAVTQRCIALEGISSNQGQTSTGGPSRSSRPNQPETV